jgi:quinol monooxygenase YgiN
MEFSQTSLPLPSSSALFITMLLFEMMSKIQVNDKIRIPRGKIKEFKEAAADYIKHVRKKDTGTLQADWFLSSDGTECEIREAYENSEAVLKHPV